MSFQANEPVELISPNRPKTESMLNKAVEDIWVEYDEDRSGKLSKKEASKFLESVLSEMLGR